MLPGPHSACIERFPPSLPVCLLLASTGRVPPSPGQAACRFGSRLRKKVFPPPAPPTCRPGPRELAGRPAWCCCCWDLAEGWPWLYLLWACLLALPGSPATSVADAWPFWLALVGRLPACPPTCLSCVVVAPCVSLPPSSPLPPPPSLPASFATTTVTTTTTTTAATTITATVTAFARSASVPLRSSCSPDTALVPSGGGDIPLFRSPTKPPSCTGFSSFARRFSSQPWYFSAAYLHQLCLHRDPQRRRPLISTACSPTPSTL
ncbi:uncharacterized protein PSFLO_05192 [Pseudozyma flocculosa]|uniref:Uncharacterized protein n=1 Tax=Pseudozyma flocculosa TaxID=84751 RepID=A0A5C3F8N4_9BASI|nr:uncharacterized protein PSFLO_05192 [Pseudozyma flocculosa]